MASIECLGSLSDLEVVDRVLRGETALYELLMRRYDQRVFRVVRSVVTHDEEAQDILQDAWVRAFEHLSQFEGRSSFSTWLTKIAYYEAIARARKSKRFVALENESGEIALEAESVSEENPEA
jgi:RNA polymerase sigma-70 factor (ECF subfamily)